MGFLRRLFGGSQEQQPPMQTVDAWMLDPKREDAALAVVGEGSYQDGIGKLAGGKTRDGPVQPDHVAVLLPEPKNRYDVDAVRVVIGEHLVGYLSRDDAVAYKPVLAFAEANGRKIACKARITGGWDREGIDRGSYGVLLRAGSPVECMLELYEGTDNEVVVRTDHPWVGHLIAFTGDSRCSLSAMPLDRGGSISLATRAGMSVHPRVTKQVQLLVDCDPVATSGNERKAAQYGIPVVSEPDFWAALGVPVTVKN